MMKEEQEIQLRIVRSKNNKTFVLVSDLEKKRKAKYIYK
jgi:hypothetical protein